MARRSIAASRCGNYSGSPFTERRTVGVNDVLGEIVVRAMAELDRVREQIAYLKFWQGIMVVTNISSLRDGLRRHRAAR